MVPRGVNIQGGNNIGTPCIAPYSLKVPKRFGLPFSPFPERMERKLEDEEEGRGGIFLP